MSPESVFGLQSSVALWKIRHSQEKSTYVLFPRGLAFNFSIGCNWRCRFLVSYVRTYVVCRRTENLLSTLPLMFLVNVLVALPHEGRSLANLLNRLYQHKTIVGPAVCTSVFVLFLTVTSLPRMCTLAALKRHCVSGLLVNFLPFSYDDRLGNCVFLRPAFFLISILAVRCTSEQLSHRHLYFAGIEGFLHSMLICCNKKGRRGVSFSA
ncbi:MAG: hypothetical protein NXY57DRAFT_1007906, partial [Lentinula lateritia]